MNIVQELEMSIMHKYNFLSYYKTDLRWGINYIRGSEFLSLITEGKNENLYQSIPVKIAYSILFLVGDQGR